MFEQDTEIVNHLLSGNQKFQQLYNRHHELKERVQKAESGVSPLDHLALGEMKKQKLLAKDKMAVIIANYRRQHPQ